jgi:hypothetical protein
MERARMGEKRKYRVHAATIAFASLDVDVDVDEVMAGFDQDISPDLAEEALKEAAKEQAWERGIPDVCGHCAGAWPTMNHRIELGEWEPSTQPLSYQPTADVADVTLVSKSDN